MRKLIVLLTLLASGAFGAPQEVYLSRHPRVNRFTVNGVRVPGVHSRDQLSEHLRSPAGRNDIRLMLKKLGLNETQIAAAMAAIERQLDGPENEIGGVYLVSFPKGCEFRRITYGAGTYIDQLVRIGVTATGYLINFSYPLGTRQMTASLVVFTDCGNMSVGDAIMEVAPPCPPGETTIVPSLVPVEVPVPVPGETTIVPSLVPVEVPVPVPGETTIVPSLVPVEVPVPSVPAPTLTVVCSLTMSRSANGSGWAQNGPDRIDHWQTGNIGVAHTGVSAPRRTQPTPAQPEEPVECPNISPPSGDDLPPAQPEPTPIPPVVPVNPAPPANPGGVPDVGDGANGAGNTPPATPIDAPIGGVKPVPAPGSQDGPPASSGLRTYQSQRR